MVNKERLVERPVRVQLSRRKDWRMPPNTISVARPTRHGNPFKVVPWGKRWGVLQGFRLGSSDRTFLGFEWTFATSAEARAHAVELFRAAVDDGRVKVDVAALRGSNLACWCPLDEPCHADVLLELANAAGPQPPR